MTKWSKCQKGQNPKGPKMLKLPKWSKNQETKLAKNAKMVKIDKTIRMAKYAK